MVVSSNWNPSFWNNRFVCRRYIWRNIFNWVPMSMLCATGLGIKPDYRKCLSQEWSSFPNPLAASMKAGKKCKLRVNLYNFTFLLPRGRRQTTDIPQIRFSFSISVWNISWSSESSSSLGNGCAFNKVNDNTTTLSISIASDPIFWTWAAFVFAGVLCVVLWIAIHRRGIYSFIVPLPT